MVKDLIHRVLTPISISMTKTVNKNEYPKNEDEYFFDKGSGDSIKPIDS